MIQKSITLPGGLTISLPNCLLARRDDEEEGDVVVTTIDIEPLQGLQVDQMIATKLLLGTPVEVPQTNLFDYYLLFRYLQDRKRTYLVCRLLERVRSIEILLDLYAKCLEGGRGPQDCVFAYAVGMQLKEREREIGESEELCARIAEMGIAETISNMTTALLRTHKELHLDEMEIPRTFKDVFREMLRDLHQTKRGWNVMIHSARAGEDIPPIRCHLDILIWQSNFFYRLLQRRKSEREEEEEEEFPIDLEIEHLGPEAVESLIEYVYLERITTNESDVLLPLLTHADMHIENRMLNHLKSRVKEITRGIIEGSEHGDEFEVWLRQYASRIENQKIVGDLTWYWSSFRGWTKERIDGVLRDEEEESGGGE